MEAPYWNQSYPVPVSCQTAWEAVDAGSGLESLSLLDRELGGVAASGLPRGWTCPSVPGGGSAHSLSLDFSNGHTRSLKP